MNKADAVRKALVNSAGAGQFTDSYLRERIVPLFLDQLKREGFIVIADPNRERIPYRERNQNPDPASEAARQSGDSDTVDPTTLGAESAPDPLTS